MSFTKNKIIQLKTCFIFDKEKRREKRRELLEQDLNGQKLIMTLLAKDEADIIRENVLFHKAMGVDGIIVTDNDSTDGTWEILQELKEQGHILELIKETTVEHYQKKWVDKMIKIAAKKYKADWIINSDSDEFWYTPSLNLKKEIIKCAGDRKNILQIFLKNFVPVENNKDFLHSTYFKNRGLADFEAKDLGVSAENYDGTNKVFKVIHKAKGYKEIAQGNHYVKMNKNNAVLCPAITIYHYAIRNYEHFERKTIKGGKSHENHPDKNCATHWREWYELYKQGKLKDKYTSLFELDKIDDLVKFGAISQDSSIINFLKYKNIK